MEENEGGVIINISKDLVTFLKGHYINPKESFEDVIWRLIKDSNTSKNDFNAPQPNKLKKVI